MIFPCVLPRQLEPIYSLLIDCILYFLRRSFQLNSRNLEMNVNSVQARNQDFMRGGANEAKVDQTTEMYFLLSDPFI